MYHKLYEGAQNEKNEYQPYTINWWDVPGRDEKWKAQTIANTSELQFEQEFGNSFLGTGNTLISANCLLSILFKLSNPCNLFVSGVILNILDKFEILNKYSILIY